MVGKTLALLLVLAMFPCAAALESLNAYVNDEAGVISDPYEALLTQELERIRQDTSVEMAIATVKTLGGTAIEDYSLRLAHNTLGDAGKDNGLLLFLAVDDRQYRIEVGYGLEGTINAALAGRIGRAYMEPHFREGNYEQGFLNAERVIGEILRNDTSAETQAALSEPEVDQNAINAVITLVIMFVILMMILGSIMRKKGNRDDDDDFFAAILAATMFGRGGRGGGGFGGGGFGGGGFGGGGFSGKF